MNLNLFIIYIFTSDRDARHLLRIQQSSQRSTHLDTQGHKHFSGFEEVVLKNINACKEITAKIKRSLGPNGNILLHCKMLKQLLHNLSASWIELWRGLSILPFLNLFK